MELKNWLKERIVFYTLYMETVEHQVYYEGLLEGLFMVYNQIVHNDLAFTNIDELKQYKQSWEGGDSSPSQSTNRCNHMWGILHPIEEQQKFTCLNCYRIK